MNAHPDELALAAQLLGPRVRADVPIANLTTYRVGGNAALSFHVESLADLWHVSMVLTQCDIPVTVIGRGSNVLVSDGGFSGLVLTLGDFANEVTLPTERGAPGETASARFGGGVALPVASRQSVAHGLTGFEWAVGVPGSIGGAVRMNAGGHGSDMASNLSAVRLFHLRKGIDCHVQALDLGLRFRGSALTDDHIVLSAELHLAWAESTGEGEARITEIVRWRREHQPGGQNAGSVFVNPDPGKVSAGALIDQLGLRGLRVGTACISDKHANFIQADEGGKAIDVVRLMAEIKSRVREAYGYDLRSEIRLLGFELTGDERLDALLTSEADTNVATIRLEQAIDRESAGTTDSSIPVAALESQLTGSQAQAGVDPLALAELREVFLGDQTGEVSISTDDRSAPGREPSQATVVADGSVAPSDAEPSTAGPIDGAGASGRVVIVDDDLRQSTEIDFPQDSQSQTVNVAPTSQRVIITDDLVDEGGELVSTLVDRRKPSGWRLLLRRVVKRRAVRNRRKTILYSMLGLVGSLVFVLIVLASPLVAVSRVEIEGVTYADQALIESVAESMKGTSVLTVDTEAAQRRLESDPWIGAVRIRTYLPNRVVIEVRERRPAAWFVGVDNRGRVIDVEGRVLAVVDGRPTEYLWVEGTGPNLVAGSIADPSYRAAAQLALSLPAELEPIVEKLGVSGAGDVTMTLTTGTLVNFGQPVDMRNKLVNVVVLVRRQDPNKILSIDVSAGTPVVESK
ncbi:MAG: UDP-N-acetylmuramate dehydrogenase [Ilumatobacteraceae bacterium]